MSSSCGTQNKGKYFNYLSRRKSYNIYEKKKFFLFFLSCDDSFILEPYCLRIVCCHLDSTVRGYIYEKASFVASFSFRAGVWARH